MIVFKNKLDMSIRFFLITLTLLFYNISSFSQIILGQTDLPKPGDVQLSYKVDSLQGATLSPGDSGANVIWYFDNLNYYNGTLYPSVDSVRWVYPDSIGVFPLANIALKSNCYLVHNWTTHVLDEVCYRDYYIKDSTGLVYYASSFPYSHDLYDYRTVFPLLSYGQTKVDHSRIVIQKSIDSTFVTNVIDTMVADAWGEVVTILDSYFTVRIHTKETVWDSLYINGIGQLVNFMPDNYYYKWYSKDIGFPVMQINKGILEKRSDYQVARFFYMKRNDVKVNSIYSENFSIQIIPNPITNEAKIVYNHPATENNISMYVYDLTGQQVLVKNNLSESNNTINRNELSSGMYSFKIISDKMFIGAGKFIVL